MLTKEIMLTKTINNYNNKKKHTPSQMNLSMLASITKREKEESRLVLNINTISVFFSSRQTLYDLTELLVGSKSQKVRQ